MNRKAAEAYKSYLVGIVAGILFLILHFIAKAGVWLSVGTGLVLLVVGIKWLAPPDKKGKKSGWDLPEEPAAGNDTPVPGQKQVENALEEGKTKLQQMRLYAERMTNIDSRRKIEDICRIVEKIFIDLDEHPEDIEPAETFLTRHLDSALNIIKKYVELKEQSIDTPGLRETLERVESVLVTMRKAFEKQLEKLLEDDVQDLDTEIESFTKAIKTEGLDDNK